ncbi:hypothetical protein ACXWQB_09590, partial [Streptococcus pyogenes]
EDNCNGHDTEEDSDGDNVNVNGHVTQILLWSYKTLLHVNNWYKSRQPVTYITMCLEPYHEPGIL